MQTRKCCLHCPGTWMSSHKREEHNCNLPTYVTGNFKLSSMKKYVVGEDERSKTLRGHLEKTLSIQPNSCHDRFSIAKKFHSENLKHQPLPDKVDDSVFKNIKTTLRFNETSKNRGKSNGYLPVYRSPSKNCHKLSADIQYAPTLGCKTPTTNMDLAICWEAPLDPCYEPPWPAHIDGSNGYPGPAVFTRVQHENKHNISHNTPMERFEAKYCNVKNHCDCNKAAVVDLNDNFYNTKRIDNDNSKCLPICNNSSLIHKNYYDNEGKSGVDLYENLDAIHISEDNCLVKSSCIRNPGKVKPIHFCNCLSYECKGNNTKPCKCQSIHSPSGKSAKINNGLITKAIIPRPKTPYAKRNYFIDTLAPPFNIVDGCRDADYPEHWRLTSVYQQSYRNPRKHKSGIVN